MTGSCSLCGHSVEVEMEADALMEDDLFLCDSCYSSLENLSNPSMNPFGDMLEH